MSEMSDLCYLRKPQMILYPALSDSDDIRVNVGVSYNFKDCVTVRIVSF